MIDADYLFLNFLLPNPVSPIKPEPRRSMVAGSGTGLGEVFMKSGVTSCFVN